MSRRIFNVGFNVGSIHQVRSVHVHPHMPFGTLAAALYTLAIFVQFSAWLCQMLVNPVGPQVTNFGYHVLMP